MSGGRAPLAAGSGCLCGNRYARQCPASCIRRCAGAYDTAGEMTMASEARAAAPDSELGGGRPDSRVTEADAAVTAAGQAALAGSGSLRQVSDDTLDAALPAIAAQLRDRAASVLAANHSDLGAARADGRADAFVDRLGPGQQPHQRTCPQLA